MDKMIQKVMKDGEKKAPVKSIKIKFATKNKKKKERESKQEDKGENKKTEKKRKALTHVLRQKKSPFSQGKAKDILRERKPTLKGHPITPGQRGLLGLIAGGGKPTRTKRKGMSKAQMIQKGGDYGYVKPGTRMPADTGPKRMYDTRPIKLAKRKKTLLSKMKHYKQGSGKRMKLFKQSLARR